MDYIERDFDAIMAYCETVVPAEPKVTVLPPQKTPRWAKQRTARAVGIRLGNGNYMRGLARVS